MEDDSLPVDATQAVPMVVPAVAPPPVLAPVVAPVAAVVPWPASHAAPTVPTVIESKVVASTSVALVASISVAVLNGVTANSSLLGGLPPAVQALVLALVPPLLTFAAGYQTRSNRVPS